MCPRELLCPLDPSTALRGAYFLLTHVLTILKLQAPLCHSQSGRPAISLSGVASANSKRQVLFLHAQELRCGRRSGKGHIDSDKTQELTVTEKVQS